MTDERITELDELTSPDAGDLIPIVDDPAGTPVTKKITRSNFLTGMADTAAIDAAIDAHEGLSDPHPGYLTPAEGAAAYEAAGAVATHAAAGDPHPTYLTAAEGNAAYQPVDSDLTAIAALSTTSYGRAFLALADQAALMALLDKGEDADVTTQAFGDTPAIGANNEYAGAGHKHGMPANPKLGNLFIPAAAMVSSVTSGAGAATQTESATNKQNRVTASFVDGSTTYLEAFLLMPSDYDGGTFTAEFVWLAGGTTTNTCRWQVEARSYGDGETLDQAFGTAQAVDDAHTSTANQILRSAATGACTAAGTPAASELMWFRFARLGGHANDNLAVTVELVGVRIVYTRT